MDADVGCLIEAIEESFEVTFSPGELADDARIDDVANALRSRLGNQTTNVCFTAHAFWRLRRTIVDTLDLAKSSIAPSTTLESLIPQIHRRAIWRKMSEATNLRLPRLEFSRECGIAIFWASILPPLALLVFWGGGWAILAAIVAMPVTAAVLFAVLKPLANAFPAHCETVGATAKTVVGLNYAKLSAELGPSREREQMEAVRYVIADATGINANALLKNPRLIDLVNDGLRMQI